MTYPNATSPQSGEFDRATFPQQLFKCLGCGGKFTEEELRQHKASGYWVCSDCLDAWLESDKLQDAEKEESQITGNPI